MLLSAEREFLRQRRTGANPHANSGYGGGESVKAPKLVGDLLDLRNVTWRDNSSPFGMICLTNSSKGFMPEPDRTYTKSGGYYLSYNSAGEGSHLRT
jgi:hypothetical protein